MPVTIVDAGPQQVSRSIEVNAPAAELFAMVADPRRHHELDGSDTVGDNVKCPDQLVPGSRFTTGMRMFGVPYRITSTVTAVKPGQLFEWRHPVGHRWRWEFAAVSPTVTRVTRDLRLSRRRTDQERAEVLRADGLRQGQRERHRGHVDQIG